MVLVEYYRKAIYDHFNEFQGDGTMRFILAAITVSVLFFCSVSAAESPPFQTVTITGKAKDLYDKVSLFEKGSSKKPLKTIQVSQPDGTYSMVVNIPEEMRKKENYFYTDMRFWGDKNDNGMKDPGEPISECHFIIWVPSAKVVFMQVYKGPRHQFKSSTLEYDYK